jgi:hypothetical protein
MGAARGRPARQEVRDVPVCPRALGAGGVRLGSACGRRADRPFVGEFSDPLNYPGTAIVPQFSIFGGRASLNSHNGSTLIHYLLSSSLGGNLVSPRTGAHILGFTEGPGIFLFDPPVQRFGAYFNNTSGADDATCEFFGPGNEPLASLVATTPAPGNQWVWNGWESDVPISRIVVTGILWFEDLEITTVPAPGAAAAVWIVLLGAVRRRRPPRPA